MRFEAIRPRKGSPDEWGYLRDLHQLAHLLRAFRGRRGLWRAFGVWQGCNETGAVSARTFRELRVAAHGRAYPLIIHSYTRDP